jgi:DNA primase large subunit
MLRREFIRLEEKIFMFRYELCSNEEKYEFMEDVDIEYQKVSGKACKYIGGGLSAIQKCDPVLSLLPSVSMDDYIGVDFEEVPHLVERRLAYLIKGMAVLHVSQSVHCARTKFVSELRREIMKSEILLVELERTDVRVARYVHAITCKNSIGLKDGIICGRNLSLRNVDCACQRSFPVCMKYLHFQLRENHHLNNTMRFVYILFLRYCGMSMDDCIDLFCESFTRCGSRSMSAVRREFIGYIRYNYESDGSHGNLQARGCQYMFSELLNSGGMSGCPMKFMGLGKLYEFLVMKGGLCETEACMVCDVVYVKGEKVRHPFKGCCEYFRLVHNGRRDFGTGSKWYPNTFYLKSSEIHRENMIHKMEEDIAKMPVVSGEPVKVRVCEDLTLKGEKTVMCPPVVATFSAFPTKSTGSSLEKLKILGDKIRRVSMSVSPGSGEKGNSENSSVVFNKKK